MNRDGAQRKGLDLGQLRSYSALSASGPCKRQCAGIEGVSDLKTLRMSYSRLTASVETGREFFHDGIEEDGRVYNFIM